jgi:hypothetical protein
VEEWRIETSKPFSDVASRLGLPFWGKSNESEVKQGMGVEEVESLESKISGARAMSTPSRGMFL